MNAEGFCFWLKGFLDTSKGEKLTKSEVDLVRQRLAETLINVENSPIPTRCIDSHE